MKKITIKEYAKKLTKNRNGELFCFDFFNFFLSVVEKETNPDSTENNRKIILEPDQIDLVP